MLEVIWSKTEHVMFFESGEDSEIKLLNIKGNPEDWLEKELQKLKGSPRIEKIGKFPKREEKGIHKTRTLFAIYK